MTTTPAPSAAQQTTLPLGQAEPAAPGGPELNPAAPVKPEGLPDRYFDPTTGVRLNEVAATLADVEAKNAANAEAFKDFPTDAAKAGEFYKLPEAMLPEGVKLPDGVTFEPNKALLERALPVLHAHKIPPAAFHDLTRAFNAYQVEAMQADMKSVADDNAKLGANGPARRKAVFDSLTSAVGPEMAKFADPNAPSTISSGAIELFEAIVAKMSNQSTVVPFNQNRDTSPAPNTDKPLIDRLADSMYPQTQKAS
jgi:hypothetical protein